MQLGVCSRCGVGCVLITEDWMDLGKSYCAACALDLREAWKARTEQHLAIAPSFGGMHQLLPLAMSGDVTGPPAVEQRRALEAAAKGAGFTCRRCETSCSVTDSRGWCAECSATFARKDSSQTVTVSEGLDPTFPNTNAVIVRVDADATHSSAEFIRALDEAMCRAVLGESAKPSAVIPYAPEDFAIRFAVSEGLDAAVQRANALADRCQVLEEDKRELLVENAELRRKVERLERIGR